MSKVSREDIIRRIADRKGLPISTVREAVESQFELVANVIKGENIDTVKLRYFGKFKMRPNRIKLYLRGYSDEKKEERKKYDNQR